MIKDQEKTISFTGHTNLPYEISGEKKLNIWQEVGLSILGVGAMWILAILILSI